MEDPVIGMLKDLMRWATREFSVTEVHVERGADRIKIVFVLSPVDEGSSVAIWRLLDLEKRIERLLGFKAGFSCSRISLTREGLLEVTYIFERVVYD